MSSERLDGFYSALRLDCRVWGLEIRFSLSKDCS